MPILVDGNNLLHRLPAGSRNRRAVRSLTLDLARSERIRVTLVFDGQPPSGSPPAESLGNVTIRYAAPRTADDVIIAALPAGGRARDWVVITDDRGLAARARGRGARVRSLRSWQERLRSAPSPGPADRPLSRSEVADWESYFSTRSDPED